MAAGIAATLAMQLAPRPVQTVTRTPVVAAVLEDAGSPAAGATAAAADVTVVVFTDYQCPICKADDRGLEALLASDPKVRVVFKDWPVLGPASLAAAKVALAADRQGKYLAVHRALTAARVRLDEHSIRRIAVEAGADGARLSRDEAAFGPQIDQQLGRHATQAWSLGFVGTPGYLVGPYLIAGKLDARRLRQTVSRARKAGAL